MKKMTAMLLCLLLAASLLTGCGAKSEAMYDAASSMAAAEESYAIAPQTPEAGMGFYEEPVEEEMAYEEPAGAPEVPEPDASLDVGDKIIYSADLYLETTAFDQAVAAVEAMVRECGGYIQNSSANGSTRYNDDGTTSVVDRCAYYTIAVPQASFETVLTKTGGIGNVISQSRNAENVSSQYTDTEARLESLRVQEERLLAMMAETTDIESLIALEERLSAVNYEIESYQRTLNDWDRRIAYSSINITLQEVEVYTPTVAVTRTFGERIGDAFRDGWVSFGRGMQAVAIGLVAALPVLILLGVIAAVTVVIVRVCIRRSRKKKAARSAEKPAE